MISPQRVSIQKPTENAFIITFMKVSTFNDGNYYSDIYQIILTHNLKFKSIAIRLNDSRVEIFLF